MSTINSIAHAIMYGFAWLVISCGVTMFLAAAFFGFPKEISKEEYDDFMKGEQDDL